MKTVFGTIAGMVVVVGLTVGGWQLGWWVKGETVNRNAEISQDSYGRQVALVDDITRKYAEVQNPDLPANQARAITTEMCVSFGFLTGTVPLAPAIANYLNTECN